MHTFRRYESCTCFVHEVQRLTMDIIKKRMPGVTKVQYISDGCASQYGNYKNFLNVCYHKEDAGLEADWIFLPPVMVNRLVTL